MSDPIEPSQDEPEAPSEEVEVVEAVVEPPKQKKAPRETPDFIRAEAGDSYLSIARRYFPDEAPGLVAPRLSLINQRRPIREGVRIFLKDNR